MNTLNKAETPAGVLDRVATFQLMRQAKVDRLLEHIQQYLEGQSIAETYPSAIIA